jgi:hypothetical protein
MTNVDHAGGRETRNVVILVKNGIGFGHIRRALVIAEAIRARGVLRPIVISQATRWSTERAATEAGNPRQRCELIPDGSTAHDLAIQIGKSLRAPRPGPASLTDSAAMTGLGQRLRLLAQTKQDENSLPDLSDIHI